MRTRKTHCRKDLTGAVDYQKLSALANFYIIKLNKTEIKMSEIMKEVMRRQKQ